MKRLSFASRLYPSFFPLCLLQIRAIFGFVSDRFGLLCQPDLVTGLKSLLFGFRPLPPAVDVFPA
jgi:hypothetical protein